jgi:hypothetical protein
MFLEYPDPVLAEEAHPQTMNNEQRGDTLVERLKFYVYGEWFPTEEKIHICEMYPRHHTDGHEPT